MCNLKYFIRKEKKQAAEKNMPRTVSALDFLALIHVQFPVPVEGIPESSWLFLAVGKFHKGGDGSRS